MYAYAMSFLLPAPRGVMQVSLLRIHTHSAAFARHGSAVAFLRGTLIYLCQYVRSLALSLANFGMLCNQL
jgi:hypothetical protein